MTKKQQRAIETIKWFIPTSVTDWTSPKIRNSTYAILGLDPHMQDDKMGLSAEEAFFLKTERGKIPEHVNDVGKLASYLAGHKWMATHKKMWIQGFQEGILFKSDFDSDPDYIQDIASKCFDQR